MLYAASKSSSNNTCPRRAFVFESLFQLVALSVVSSQQSSRANSTTNVSPPNQGVSTRSQSTKSMPYSWSSRLAPTDWARPSRDELPSCSRKSSCGASKRLSRYESLSSRVLVRSLHASMAPLNSLPVDVVVTCDASNSDPSRYPQHSQFCRHFATITLSSL